VACETEPDAVGVGAAVPVLAGGAPGHFVGGPLHLFEALALSWHVPAPTAAQSAEVRQGTWQRSSQPAQKLWQTMTSPHPRPFLQASAERCFSGSSLHGLSSSSALPPPLAPADPTACEHASDSTVSANANVAATTRRGEEEGETVFFGVEEGAMGSHQQRAFHGLGASYLLDVQWFSLVRGPHVTTARRRRVEGSSPTPRLSRPCRGVSLVTSWGVRQAGRVRASFVCGAFASALAVGACSSAFLGAGGDGGAAAEAGAEPDARPRDEPVDAADASPPAPEASAPDAADSAPPAPFRVFVTNAVYDGKPGNGGLLSADDLCQQAASKLPPVTPARGWKAYLADGAHPGARFGDPKGGWVRPDGAQVFASRADLVAGRLPQSPISLTELGAPAPGGNLVWTGMANNSPAGNTCDRWRSGAAAETGRVGSTVKIDQSWQSEDNSACNFSRHLFCFEQPLP